MSVYFSQQSLLVAPNERQALALWEADAQAQQEAGAKAWETLPVCSWTELLSALWEEYWLSGAYQTAPATLMNEWQERFLWMKVLSESPLGQTLLNVPAAAKLAAEAWKLTNSYQLQSELWDERNYWSDETLVFKSWAEAFQQERRKRNWLEACRLESVLAELLAQNVLPSSVLPSQVRLIGFAEWTPSAQAFLNALQEAGVQIFQDREAAFPEMGEWRQISASHGEEEIHLAGRWLRRQLEREPGRKLKVGLVVPDLAERREEIARILAETFHAEQLLDLSQTQEPIFDFSVGLPLSRWPVVKQALNILKMDGRPLPLDDWTSLLTSPFLSQGEKEADTRALLQNRLLSDGRFRIEWNTVRRLAAPRNIEGKEERACCSPALARSLESAEKILEEAAKFQRPSLWATHFSNFLECFGWPGERSLSSHEYQTVTRMKSTLAQLGSLDGVLGTVSREEALTALIRISDESVYQPKSSSGSVEVLGTLEAVGLQFDYLWLAGIHDGVWPAGSQPNPYLPFSLQREHGVAHSTPERELEFAQLVTQRLFMATKFGVASYPLHSQAQSCRPSPLIAHLDPTSLERLKLSDAPSVSRLYWHSRKAEIVEDPGPPPVGTEEESKGGTSLFKYQAACPFRAFVYSRLGARPQEVVQEGLDARERGTILHAALEELWKEVKTLRSWLNYSSAQKHEVLERSAAAAVEAMRRKRPDVLKGAMVGLERRRLVGLLSEWMECESERADFVVLATEKKVELKFAGLAISATIDRIDRLADGSLAVIDYKTGDAWERDWLGERPKEPQLPLYSVAHAESVEAVCFAIVKTGKMRFRGLAAKDEQIPGVKASEYADDGAKFWPDRKSEWRARLESLATEFRSGHVIVDPAEGEQSCKYCGYQSLCRIDEKSSEIEIS